MVCPHPNPSPTPRGAYFLTQNILERRGGVSPSNFPLIPVDFGFGSGIPSTVIPIKFRTFI